MIRDGSCLSHTRKHRSLQLSNERRGIEMMAWLSANLINIVLIAVLALITGLLIYSMIRSKKQGKSSCGGSCSACGACNGCGIHAKNSKI